MLYKSLKKVLDCAEGLECTFVHPFTGAETIRVFERERLSIPQILAWASGTYIQDAMPKLNQHERELFLNADMMRDFHDENLY
jgi:hypothetical protein